MEPITSLITASVGYLIGKIKNNGKFQDFLDEFTGEAVMWLRPIFLKDDETPKDVLRDLTEEPDDELNIQEANISIAKAIRNNPALERNLRLLSEEILLKAGPKFMKTNTQNISGNENIGMQDISDSKINISPK